MEVLKDIEKKLPIGQQYRNQYFDLAGVPCGQLSPPFADSVAMEGEFETTPLINGFVRNILYRQISLRVSAWRRLIQFITGKEFVDDSSRVCLQLLFLYSKADPVEIEQVFRPYSVFFDGFIIPSLSEFEVERMDDGEASKIKSFLALPITMTAFERCLEEVMGDLDGKLIPDAIASMVVYKGNAPLPLRGATVRDGIFLNYPQLCNTSVEEKNDADLFTIAGHETVHFLARKFSNNFNFSSPFSGCANGMVRKEAGSEKNLELGRLFELKMFGMQPNWMRSEKEAASKFLQLVKDETSQLPLNIGAGLQARPTPSPSFGIDLVTEPDNLMC